MKHTTDLSFNCKCRLWTDNISCRYGLFNFFIMRYCFSSIREVKKNVSWISNIFPVKLNILFFILTMLIRELYFSWHGKCPIWFPSSRLVEEVWCRITETLHFFRQFQRFLRSYNLTSPCSQTPSDHHVKRLRFLIG